VPRREREREGGRGDDGNGAAGAAAAVAAVADVAIPSASCYFLQRFSVLLSRLRHRKLIKKRRGGRRRSPLPISFDRDGHPRRAARYWADGNALSDISHLKGGRMEFKLRAETRTLEISIYIYIYIYICERGYIGRKKDTRIVLLLSLFLSFLGEISRESSRRADGPV